MGFWITVTYKPEPPSTIHEHGEFGPFLSPDLADQALANLTARPDIIQAVIYDKAGD
jgi:hypothetical protein